MMKLGLFFQQTGRSPTAWRQADVPQHANTDFTHMRAVAQTAERALFDFILLADTFAASGPDDLEFWRRTSAVVRLDPIVICAVLSEVTHNIGFVVTGSTLYVEPYILARTVASLEHLNGGRMGWNIVTSGNPVEATNFGRNPNDIEHDDRYERASEYAEAVFGLWDTFADDAFVEDREAGIYFDVNRFHMIAHKGKHFSIRGPLTVPRSPQGRPVSVSAGQSVAGRDLAAQHSEVIFVVQQDLDKARELYADIKQRVTKFGRSPDEIRVMPGLIPIVGRTLEEARAKQEYGQSLMSPEIGVKFLSQVLGGFDLSPYPIDGPLPEMPVSEIRSQGRQKVVVDLARRDNLTIRQLYQALAGENGHLKLVGTPETIVDTMEQWYSTGAADGFNIMADSLPNGLEDFATLVVPELQRRGLYRTHYEGTTLRANLGLPRPKSRWD